MVYKLRRMNRYYRAFHARFSDNANRVNKLDFSDLFGAESRNVLVKISVAIPD